MPDPTRLPVPYFDRPVPAALSEEHRGDASALRSLICHVGRLMHEARFLCAMSGSISVRLNDEHMLITPPTLSKGFLQPEHILQLPLKGTPPSNPVLAADWQLHAEVLVQRADIAGVIHAHPPMAVALTVAGVSMRTCVVPDAVVLLGLVPTAVYSAPGSPERVEVVRALTRQHDALLLAHDGAVTLGTDVWGAFLKLELLEHTATVLHHAAQLGPIPPLTPGQVVPLLALRRQLGYWRAGDDEAFCAMCGVC